MLQASGFENHRHSSCCLPLPTGQCSGVLGQNEGSCHTTPPEVGVVDRAQDTVI